MATAYWIAVGMTVVAVLLLVSWIKEDQQQQRERDLIMQNLMRELDRTLTRELDRLEDPT